MFKDALRIQAEQHKQEKEHIFNELQKEWSEIIQKITAKQIFKEIDNEERKLRQNLHVKTLLDKQKIA